MRLSEAGISSSRRCGWLPDLGCNWRLLRFAGFLRAFDCFRVHFGIDSLALDQVRRSRRRRRGEGRGGGGGFGLGGIGGRFLLGRPVHRDQQRTIRIGVPIAHF